MMPAARPFITPNSCTVRAAIHHAKLMHRHLLDLGYPVSAERDMETFVWWMAHREGWLKKTSAVA